MPGPHYLAGSSTISTEPEADGGREVAAGGGWWVGGRVPTEGNSGSRCEERWKTRASRSSM